MRKHLNTLYVLLLFPAALNAGFSFGLINATKKTVDKVDSKVAAEKHVIDAGNTSLSWTSEANYISDGLNKAGGDVSTSFVYRVKYTNIENIAPAAGYPKVHIKKGGAEISGSPFPMSFVSGAYNTGAIYTCSTAIASPGDDYTYYFEARNLSGTVAAGTPAAAVDAPDVAIGWIFSTPKSDYGYSVQQTSDAGYIIVGSTDPSDAGGVWLIKTDLSGSKLWDKTFIIGIRDEGYSVQQTADGGYIITGAGGGLTANNIILLKIDSSGNQSWVKDFGGPDYEVGYSVQQTSDGGYIIAGAHENTFGDVWLLKTDSSGNQSWVKTFDGGGAYDSAQSVQQTSDGGYIIAGEAHSDIWLFKTDTSGNQSWTKTFGSSYYDRGYSVKQTADGGYIIIGSSGSPNFLYGPSDVLLIKTDSSGNKTWEKTFGGVGDDVGFSLSTTTDGGYIIAGYTGSYGAGAKDVWLIKTDSSGNQSWAKTFGGIGDDIGHSVKQTADGGYVVTGNTMSYGAGDSDVWLIKTDSNGNAQ